MISFRDMDDADFMDIAHRVFHELRRRSKIWEQNMPKLASDRATRLPNSQTIAQAAANVLCRVGEAGATKDEVAQKIKDEEGYQTETKGRKWTHSVYQSGLRPLIKDGLVVAIAEEGQEIRYFWAGPSLGASVPEVPDEDETNDEPDDDGDDTNHDFAVGPLPSYMY